MARLRRLSSRELLRALRQVGFEVVSTRGSHAKLCRRVGEQRQCLTIPLHDELAPGTLHAIFRQACRFVPASEMRRLFFT